MAENTVSPSVENKSSKFFYGYIIVIAGFFVLMLAYGSVYTFGSFFKPVSQEFGWTRAMTSGAYSLYQVLHGFLGIFAGRLSDRLGPRVVVTICGLSLGLGYILMSQINSIWQLYLYYGVLVSLGMSSGYIPIASAAARWFVKRRGLMTGLLVSGTGVGTVILPPVASQLITIFNWSTSYIILGAIVLVIIVIAAQFLRPDPVKMGLLPYGGKEVKVEHVASEVGGFSLREAMRNRQYWVLIATFFLFLFSQQAIMVHIVPHATDLGNSAVSAAIILSVIGGAGIAGRIGMGGAGDRIGNKRSLVIGLILQAVSLISLLGMKELWMFYVFAAIYGFGYGSMIALQTPILAELFGLKSLGAILGMLIFVGTIGGAIGPLVVGMIFDSTSSYTSGFILCAVLSVISIALAVMVKFPARHISGGSV